jgi:hypothetical protein
MCSDLPTNGFSGRNAIDKMTLMKLYDLKPIIAKRCGIVNTNRSGKLVNN